MVSDRTVLIHYGVSGMKWGVRREIGARARAGAVTARGIASEAKRHNKALRKVEARASRHTTVEGIISDKKITKLLNRMDLAKSRIAKMNSLKERMLSGLSPSDIEKGKRQVSMLLSPLLNTPITALAMVGEYNKVARKYGG